MQLVLNDEVGRREPVVGLEPEEPTAFRVPWQHRELVHGANEQCRSLLVDCFINDMQRQPLFVSEVTVRIFAAKDHAASYPFVTRRFVSTFKIHRSHRCSAPRTGEHDKRIVLAVRHQ